MAELKFYVGMPDAEMHSILEASCGVEDCTITAQALFHAAPWGRQPTYLPTGGRQSRRPCGPSSPTYLRTYLTSLVLG